MSFLRSLITVSGLTVLSRVGGFVRDALTAVYLGADARADAFFVAQRLPNLFRSLFAEGAFSAAFVPLYTTKKERDGLEAATRFAGEALALLVALLTPFSFLVMLGMPWVVRLMAPGFHDEPDKFELAVSLSRITFPYLLLISITALQTGVLNARGIFGPGAAAPILLNIIMILALLIADWIGFDTAATLAWAMTLAGGMQAGWLAVSCFRARAAIPLVRPRMTQAVRELFKKIGPGAVGAGATQINILLTTILASTLPTGAVSFLYYADRLNQLPIGIVGIAVGTTLLPVLARHETVGDTDKVRHYVSRAIEFCLFLGLPSALGLGLAAKPIIRTLFEHGAFTPADTIETAKTLAAYAASIPAFLLVKVFAAQFFARHDTRTPVKFALFAMALNVTGAVLLLQPLAHVGMALAISAATWANAGLLFLELKKKGLAVLDDQARRRVPRFLFCGAGMGLVTWLLSEKTAFLFDGSPLESRIMGLALILGLSGIVYGALLPLTGALRPQEIFGFWGGGKKYG